MKQIWKCDFCDKTGIKEEIEKHEKNCSYDKSLKNCYTCEKLIPDMIYEVCVIGFDVERYKKKGKCPKWAERWM